MNTEYITNKTILFPISRDPPEGGTRPNRRSRVPLPGSDRFPISRDPPEGGTGESMLNAGTKCTGKCFQFLGIPPKGEQ